ncbi:hypothetical protein VZT92_004817 [Zoarces viviparus]|uniref:Uncharacterized protein n=1 Tax=Zoarces viviparus TaxID=48416 RepID=A0AAW1FR96_ZOAVI
MLDLCDHHCVFEVEAHPAEVEEVKEEVKVGEEEEEEGEEGEEEVKEGEEEECQAVPFLPHVSQPCHCPLRDAVFTVSMFTTCSQIQYV